MDTTSSSIANTTDLRAGQAQRSLRWIAAATAVVVTGLQFSAVDALAHRGAPSGSRVVQLERVVITGKRVATSAPLTAPLALAGQGARARSPG